MWERNALPCKIKSTAPDIMMLVLLYLVVSQFHSGFNSYTTGLLYILQQLTGIAIKSENFE